MDPRSVIAQRIDLNLRRQLGEGVDAQRTLADPRYARDVLLVCDAMKGTELPLLARQFRTAGEHMAAEQRLARHAGPAQDWAANTSGFGVSHPPALAAARVQRDDRTSKPPAWFSPSRWLG